MDDNSIIFEFFLSAYKDKMKEQELHRIKEEFQRVCVAEISSRRSKKACMIQQIAKLRTELERFKFSYCRLVDKTHVRVPEIDVYIKQIELQIKKLSLEKNR